MGTPGPDLSDPVRLVGDRTVYTAEIALQDWRVVGAPVLVRLRDKDPWAGVARSYHPAQSMTVVWSLPDGRQHRRSLVAKVRHGFVLGGTVPVQPIEGQPTGLIVATEPATMVSVRFQVPGTPGIVLTRMFHRLGTR